MKSLVTATAIAIAVVVPGYQQQARACATAPPAGMPVTIAEESAIIVWDEATKTEHFIRRASFRSAAKDFGFLVPTPTKPELAEASDDAFAKLDNAIRPEVVYRAETSLEPTLTFLFVFSRGAKSSAPIAAMAPVRVGGYDAVVLEADDAGALAEWLKSHGYESPPALVAALAVDVAIAQHLLRGPGTRRRHHRQRDHGVHGSHEVGRPLRSGQRLASRRSAHVLAEPRRADARAVHPDSAILVRPLHIVRHPVARGSRVQAETPREEGGHQQCPEGAGALHGKRRSAPPYPSAT